MNCCYDGYIDDFINLSKAEWLNLMKNNFYILFKEEVNELQFNAWIDCYDKIINEFKRLKGKKYYLIFEYILPLEGGRRPDLILLSKDDVYIFEFKEKNCYSTANIDQLIGYARDIKEYHKESHNKRIIPVLIPTKKEQNYIKIYQEIEIEFLEPIRIISNDKIFEIITYYNSDEIEIVDFPNKWINSLYYPLPSLIKAANQIFINELNNPFSVINKANSSCIPTALEKLDTISSYTGKKSKILTLITGVPGAGKTLLGLKFVYNTQNSVFLSGNGPLVKVLQNALNNKFFVRSLKNYLEYYTEQNKMISDNIVVFDEAQRAWDANKNKKYNISEPELLVKLVGESEECSMILGLIGEGQEIYIGEEAGIEQWKSAISYSTSNWVICCPPKIGYVFKEIKNAKIIEIQEFDLNISLRSHLADEVSSWANELLINNIDVVKKLTKNIYKNGFLMYITRDLEKAKNYCRERYHNHKEKKYGLLRSSKKGILENLGIKQDFDIDIAKWYNDNNDSKYSCCSLNKVATEFDCQGLELDFPIICWQSDLIRENNNWKEFKEKNFNVKDAHRLRLNSYRVLLTRGRDGFIIYIPDIIKIKNEFGDIMNKLNDTYDFFKEIGLLEL